MSWINALLRPLFDGLLYPFRDLPPIVGLSVVSLLTAVGMLLVFKRTSNQEALEAVKRRIHACLFEIRLFNDDLGAILRAQLEILRHNLTYLRYSTAPMLWTLPPLVLMIAQLQFHYGYEGLQVGRDTLVKVRLAGDTAPDAPRPDIAISAPPGLVVDEPAVWIPSEGEMDWRMRAEAPGDYQLVVTLNQETVKKSVIAHDDVQRRSPYRSRGFLDELIYPAEPPIPSDSAIASISVTYPDASVDVFGFGLHWMIVYFVLSIVFAFLLKGAFGVVM